MQSLKEIQVQDNYGFTGGLGSHDVEDHGPQTTEWEDALVKHKIISKRIKVKTVDQLNTEWREENKIAEEIVEEHKIRTLEEIDELEDDVDEMTLLEYRRKRMRQLQEQQSKAKFGTIREITKPEFIPEVSEGSLNDQWVVCCLYVNNRRNMYMLQCLRNVAARHPDVKFCQIVGPQCIENYPERHCPTILIYLNNESKGHIKGDAQFGGEKMTADIVEWELANLGMFRTDQDEDPWKKFAKLKHISGRKEYRDAAADDEDSDSLDL